jgi:hypothetical protein
MGIRKIINDYTENAKLTNQKQQKEMFINVKKLYYNGQL